MLGLRGRKRVLPVYILSLKDAPFNLVMDNNGNMLVPLFLKCCRSCLHYMHGMLMEWCEIDFFLTRTKLHELIPCANLQLHLFCIVMQWIARIEYLGLCHILVVSLGIHLLNVEAWFHVFGCVICYRFSCWG